MRSCRPACWDGADSALKNECVYRTVYAAKEQARRDAIADTEGIYTVIVGILFSVTGTPENDVHYRYQRPPKRNHLPLSETYVAALLRIRLHAPFPSLVRESRQQAKRRPQHEIKRDRKTNLYCLYPFSKRDTTVSGTAR